MMAVYNKALQAIEDSSKQLRHLTVGITQTVAEHRMPRPSPSTAWSGRKHTLASQRIP